MVVSNRGIITTTNTTPLSLDSPPNLSSPSSSSFPPSIDNEGYPHHHREEEILPELMELKGTSPLTSSGNNNAKLEKFDESIESTTQSLYLETADLNITITGYRTHSLGEFFYSLLGFLTLGGLFLLGRWLPRIPNWFTARPSSLRDATWFIIRNQYQQEEKLVAQRVAYSGRYGQLFSLGDSTFSTKQDASLDELVTSLKTIQYRFLTLIFDPVSGTFNQLSHWQDHRWKDPSLYHQGLNHELVEERKILFPKNEIAIPPKPLTKLLTDEILHPFFVFQIFSIILWCCENYYYYAASIFIISMFSIVQTLIQTKKNWNRIQTLSRFECPVEVFRENSWSTISSTDLVPGDIINLLTPGLHTLPCDSVLIQGDAIIGEGLLTGESIPVSKVSLVDHHLLFNELGFNQSSTNQFSPQLTQSILFSGTQLIRARGNYPPPKLYSSHPQHAQALSMVIRTGFDTTKGALVRSILFPRPNVFKFYRDSFRFIGVMSLLALIGFIVSLVKLIELEMDHFLIVIRTLDLATIVVPPALPATMSVGLSFALSRLQAKGVYCIAPTRINISGKVDIVCFDKTGTLTEEGLDVLGAQEISAADHRHLASLQDPQSLGANGHEDQLQLLHCMTTCHAIKVVDGELLGDPLELRMLESTGWILEEGGASSESLASQMGLALVRPPHQPRFSLEVLEKGQDYSELAVLKAFEFIPALRRMSVLVRRWQSPTVQLYTKGAPEVIATLCTQESLPSDYSVQLKAYTQKGYRVIACAGREMGTFNWSQTQDTNRTDLERNLTFLGFIVFENRLKPATISAIRSLHHAAIRQVMCTGDNLLTAISVARECELLPSNVMIFSPRLDDVILWESVNHDEFGDYAAAPLLLDATTLLPPNGMEYALAVSGECLRAIINTAPKSVVERMLVKTQIFARMAPEEKQELVEKLQELDYCVAFCGDGANDCGALKAADVGLSLSEAEASIAAPFTSKTLDISSVPLLIREGRAALVTSFSCFKYMGLYSIIQFASIILLYNYGSNLGDYQFLIIDLFIILPVAVAMGRTQASPTLYPRSPTASLVSKKMLTSFIGQCLLQVLFQCLAYWYLLARPWFIPPIIDPEDPNVPSMVNTTLFHISSYQYIWGAVVFSVGYPYRRSMFTNFPFIITAGILLALLLWVQLDPMEWQATVLELVPIPTSFRYVLLGFAITNLVVAYLYERWAVPLLVTGLHHLQRLIHTLRHPTPTRSATPLLHKKFQRVKWGMKADLTLSV